MEPRRWTDLPDLPPGHRPGVRRYRLVVPDKARERSEKLGLLIAQLFDITPEAAFYHRNDEAVTVFTCWSVRPDDTGRAVAAVVMEVDRVCPDWRGSRLPEPHDR